jgi:hypothetical membrane protein
MASVLGRIFGSKPTAVCGILGQLLVFIAIGIAISFSPWFTWAGNALSNLGDLNNPVSAPIFNVGLIIGGIITVLFTLGLAWNARTHALALIGAIALLFAGVGSVGVGIFPENFIMPHVISAVLIFVGVIVGLLLFGFALILRRSTRILGVLSIILGLIAMFIWFLPWQGMGVAIPETVAAVAGYILSLIMSARLLAGKEAIPKK